jgi:hypothetical protein
VADTVLKSVGSTPNNCAWISGVAAWVGEPNSHADSGEVLNFFDELRRRVPVVK